MLRRWLDTPGISWEYDWMPADCLLEGATPKIYPPLKKKHGKSIHAPQRFRWQANLSSVGQVTLYLTNRLDEERILVWCLPKKVNSKWHTHQKWIWSAARFLSWPFFVCGDDHHPLTIGKPALVSKIRNHPRSTTRVPGSFIGGLGETVWWTCQKTQFLF